MDPWTVILSVIGGAFCIYLIGVWNLDYFKKRGIPHVKPLPFFGNIIGLLLRVKTINDVLQEAYNSHPEAKYVGIYNFWTPIILLKDPELVKSIAIKNFDSFPNHKMFIDSKTEPLFQKNLFVLKDDAWREMRALLSPAFTSSKMKMMYKMMSQCAINFADYLERQDPRPDELDVKETFGRYTLDVIASAAFGLSVNSMKDRDNDFYLMGKEVGNFNGSKKMLKFFFINICTRLAKLLNVKYLESKTTDFFIKVIEDTIATRDAEGIVRPDMIQLMMQARDRKEGSSLSSEDIAAQAFIFFLGGFESPATTMSFAAYMLALNPDVQRKLQAEIDHGLEKSSGEISYEDLHAMKYLDCVVSETLRLFPPSAVMDRNGQKSFTLPPPLPGLEPVRIEPGQNIWLPCYSFHHDPRYFPDPEKFDPDRFNDENKSQIPPFAYFPFGLGPRICIANRFALMEVKIVLFHLLARCDLSPTPKTSSQIKLSPTSLTVTPVGGFQLKVEPRK